MTSEDKEFIEIRWKNKAVTEAQCIGICSDCTGVPKEVIKEYLSTKGWYKGRVNLQHNRIKELAESGMKQSEIARLTGIARTTIKRWKEANNYPIQHKPRRFLTEETKQSVRDLIKQGVACKEIAKQCEVSEVYVRQIKREGFN